MENRGWVLSWLPVEARGRQAPDLLLFCPAGQAVSLSWVEARGQAGNLRESSAIGLAKFLFSSFIIAEKSPEENPSQETWGLLRPPCGGGRGSFPASPLPFRFQLPLKGSRRD